MRGAQLIHQHSVRKLMQQYTHRQIENASVLSIKSYIEQQIETIMCDVEQLLQYHGKPNQRVTVDSIQAVINHLINTNLPEKAGGIKKENENIKRIEETIEVR